MDVYQQVLHKLYEITGGKDSKTVDFKDLVKKLGFHAHYADIFTRLSNEGWLIETPKADFVRLSHWGAAEAKKTSSPSNVESAVESDDDSAEMLATAKELTKLIENFRLKNSTPDDFASVRRKFEELRGFVDNIEKRFGERLK